MPTSRPPSPATKRDSGTHVVMWCPWCQAPHGSRSALPRLPTGPRPVTGASVGILNEWPTVPIVLSTSNGRVSVPSPTSSQPTSRMDSRRTGGTTACRWPTGIRVSSARSARTLTAAGAFWSWWRIPNAFAHCAQAEQGAAPSRPLRCRCPMGLRWRFDLRRSKTWA